MVRNYARSKTVYNAAKEGRVSEEQFIMTMKVAINTFCKEILHPSYIPGMQL